MNNQTKSNIITSKREHIKQNQTLSHQIMDNQTKSNIITSNQTLSHQIKQK